MTLHNLLNRVPCGTVIKLFAPEYIGDFENLESPKFRRDWGNWRIIGIAATAENLISVSVNRSGSF